MRFILIVFFVLGFVSLNAQIAIDSADILISIGTCWENGQVENETVNVGNTGGPQNWDFSSFISFPDTNYTVIIDPSTAPAHDTFPTSNLVHKDFCEEESTFIYYCLSQNYWQLLGIENFSYNFHIIVEINDGQIPLPYTYGDSVRLSTVDTFYNPPITQVMEAYIDQVVDAYGNMSIAFGTFPSLRIKIRRCAFLTYFSPSDTFYDTEYAVGYNWVTENHPNLVSIENKSDTNFNMTTAENLSVFINYSTSVEEDPIHQVSDNIEIYKQYGIYFLNFQNIPSSSLSIYDLSGRNIYSKIITGTGIIPINISKSGIYFIAVNNKEFNFTDKIYLLK